MQGLFVLVALILGHKTRVTRTCQAVSSKLVSIEEAVDSVGVSNGALDNGKMLVFAFWLELSHR